jgi:chondroitin AC lyase
VAIPVFSLHMDLGKQVKNGSFYYTVLPGISRIYFDKYKLKDNLLFLRNDTLSQAVYHKSLNQVQAVFYQAGKLKLPWKGLNLDFLKPGLIIMKIHQEKIIIDYAQPSDKKQIVVDLHSKVKFKNNDMNIY